MTSFIVRKGFLTPSECIDVAARAALVSPVDATMMTGVNKVRGGELRWLYREHGWEDLHRKIHALLDEAERVLETIPSQSMEAVQHTTYHPVAGDWYDRHVDCFNRPPGVSDRRLSISVQLTDPSVYDGGDLRLYVPGAPTPEDTRPIGTAIVFRSETWHQADPTRRGIRRSLVTWRSDHT